MAQCSDHSTAVAMGTGEPSHHTLTPVKADAQLGRLLYIHVHEFSFSFIDFAIGTKGRITKMRNKARKVGDHFFFLFH